MRFSSLSWKIPLFSLLLIGALWSSSMVVGASQPAAAQPPVSAVLPPVSVVSPLRLRDYCYNFDFYNTTGRDANDLHITLRGPQSVSWLYEGNLSVFQNMSSGLYSDGTYQFHWSNGLAHNGQKLHLGWCTKSRTNILMPVKLDLAELRCLLKMDDIDMHDPEWGPYYVPGFWTWDGAPISNGWLPAVGHEWNYIPGHGLTINLTNTGLNAAAIRQMDVAVVNNPFALNDLNWDTTTELNWQSLNVRQDTVIPGVDAPNQVNQLPVEIPGEFSPDDPNYLVVRFWAEDSNNPENLIKGVAQVSISTVLGQ